MEWISVKEIDGLPKKKQNVIISFTNEAGKQVGECHWDGDNFIWLCEECDYKEVHPYKYPITHWMPLPKPPIK